jgi:hypothetical protein
MLAQGVVPNSDGKEGKAMTRRGYVPGRRLATLAAAGALVFSLAGDRGRAATVPASVYGQDPLEVLELKVRPNVIIVLDSSGSMTGTPSNGTDASAAYHPASKEAQAKEVVKRVVTDNESKVSFMFGQYSQDKSRLENRNAGDSRFQYYTTSMPAPELTVRRALGDDGTTERGFQSWQIIYPAWATLYFDEDAATDAVCTATLTTTTPRFYAKGADLAAALAAAMSSASCSGTARTNTYNVTYNTTTGQFTFAIKSGSRPFRIGWGRTPNNIRNALAETSTGTTTFGTGSITTDAPWTLLYRNTGTARSSTGMNVRWTLTEPINSVSTTFYQLRAGRLWNGEEIRVDSSGAVCGIVFPTAMAPAGTMTSPPSLIVQAANASCSPTAGQRAVFVFGGGEHGASNTCAGYNHKVDLIPCDLQAPPAPLQITTMMPTLQPETLFNADGTMVEYSEVQDGGWAVSTYPLATTGGARASGSTPLANSLMDLKVRFTELWDTGLSTGPWASLPDPTQAAIKNHRDPKEKTIVLFVTDGNDTCDTRSCALGETDMNALRAARKAELLYQRLVADQPASSVQTYVIGYGGAFSSGEPTRLNWIAWGGSGLTGIPTTGTGEDERWDPGCSIVNPTRASGSCTPTPNDFSNPGPYNNTTCVSNYLNPLRATCRTCTDAFVAPDANTLAAQLQAIIDQGASEGEFSAQQSVTESVFEYVQKIGTVTASDGTLVTADAAKPDTRYRGIVPTKFVSSFKLPGFKGHLSAYQNDGSGNPVLMWDAGEKLMNLVQWGDSNLTTCSGGVCSCDSSKVGGAVGQCTFSDLATRIKRRVYTTDRNGVFLQYPYNVTVLTSGGTENVAGGRQTLWPPTAPGLLKSDYTTLGTYDIALGLPPDIPTSFPPNPIDKFCDPNDTRASANPKKGYDQCWFEWLGKKLNACVGPATGNTAPAACLSGTYLSRMKAARREAREIALAYMAGAETIADTTGIKRTPTSGSVKSQILYTFRDWVLADSEMATAGVVTPPNSSEPTATNYVAEYKLLVSGAGTGADDDSMIKQGFGLVKPDGASTDVDTRSHLKPVMTVVYAPGNDMLHAFRAGPCDTAALPVSCAETGGEELWGFVPYDQLSTVLLRPANDPQGRSNHVYSLARGVRFADVFVPGPTTLTIGGEPQSVKGVWRRILYFGRGIGGKYVTALDVTSPGPYTNTAFNTVPPIPLWSRGNPDTQNGLASGTKNNTQADYDAYLRMGETWSMPTPALVNKDKKNTLYVTSRRSDGIDFALFMGSGYGDPNAAVRQGTTHYALDGLSGDVIAAVDVNDAADSAGYGLVRSGLAYPNALVANSVSFNRSRFTSAIAPQDAYVKNPHSWEFETERVFIADLHGRLWKFLTEFPNLAIPASDLGADQPVGTAVALLSEHQDPKNPDPKTMIPDIFVTSGAERRAAGPFRIFSIVDRGTDTSTTTTGTQTSTPPGPNGEQFTTIKPVEPRFVQTFEEGDPYSGCANMAQTVFRGTVQPTSAVDCLDPLSSGGVCQGEQREIVSFGGTRLAVPNTLFAPATPLACGNGQYPCRSQFDSILYMLDAVTGVAAYDLNASSPDAYRIFRDSRISAISFTASVTGGGSTFVADEGLIKGTPKPPPPPGIPPTVTSSKATVILKREPGQPSPVVQYGSTVCQ